MWIFHYYVRFSREIEIIQIEVNRNKNKEVNKLREKFGNFKKQIRNRLLHKQVFNLLRIIWVLCNL